VARSQLTAAGLSFSSLVLLGLLGILPAVGPRLPAALLRWARGLAVGALTEPRWEALAACLGLTAAALVGAWLLFRRQEL
jgi:hypothetical protein